MLFSCFTPLELFELSNEDSPAERIYDSMTAALGDQFDLTVGESRMEAIAYCTALAAGRAMQCQESAALQGLVEHVDELLPIREQEYKIIPTADATFADRVEEYSRRKARPQTAWTEVAIRETLAGLLGSDFIAYRPTPLAEVARWPVAAGDQPMNLVAPQTARKVITITPTVSVGLGAPQAVNYGIVEIARNSQSSASSELVVGDVLVVDAGIMGISERVTVEAVTTSPRTFTATFTKPHDARTYATTQPWPRWSSTKRHSLVVLTSAAAADPTVRRVVDAQMRRMVRASSTWDIVGSGDGLTTNQFLIDEPTIGVATIGVVTL